MNDELMKHYVHNIKAPNIHKYERAKIIKEYLIHKNITQREFARQFDIHHNTVQDWLLPLRLPEKKYNELVEGNSSTEIYRYLRSTKDKDLCKTDYFEQECLLILQRIKRLQQKVKNSKMSVKELIDYLTQLKKEISYLEFKIEKTMKST